MKTTTVSAPRSLRTQLTKLSRLAALGCVATSLFAQTPPVVTGLHRVGPVGGANVGMFPEWYQDSTGLAFEFGTALTAGELAAGLVLLLPGDVAATPEVYQYPAASPTTFFNEHFYWHASATNKAIPLNNGTNGTTKGKLIMGLEGAFLTAALEVPGSQVTFARIRIDVARAPYSGTYTLKTPYKTYVIPDIVAGQRIFFTEDYGVAMGNFSDALNGPIGPFLWPADATGKQLPPYSFEGRLYASDGNAASRVVGSPILDASGTGGYRNYMELSCPVPVGSPAGAQPFVWREDTFVVTGRVKSGKLPGNIALQRASRYVTPSEQRIDFLARGSMTLPTRIPGGLVTQAVPVVAGLTVYPAAPGGTAAAPTIPAGIAGITLTGNGLPPNAETFCALIGSWTAGLGQALPASITAVDDGGFVSKVDVTDTVIVQQANYSAAARTLTVTAQTADTVNPTSLYLQGVDGVLPTETFSSTKVVSNLIAPPAYVTVVSKAGGAATVPVSLGVPTANTAVPPVAANQAPIANNLVIPSSTPAIAGQAFTINLTAASTGNRDPEGAAITVSSVSGLAAGSGTVAVSADKSGVIYTPSLTASAGTGAQTFSYTITDGSLTSTTASVTVTVNDRVVVSSARAVRQTGLFGVTTGYRWNLSGTAGPGATVSIRPGTSATGTAIRTVIADATGAWSVVDYVQTAFGGAQPTQVTVTSSQRGSATSAVSAL